MISSSSSSNKAFKSFNIERGLEMFGLLTGFKFEVPAGVVTVIVVAAFDC